MAEYEFHEVGVRVWRSGPELLLSQATPDSVFQLWGIARQGNHITHRKSMGEFESMEACQAWLGERER